MKKKLTNAILGFISKYDKQTQLNQWIIFYYLRSRRFDFTKCILFKLRFDSVSGFKLISRHAEDIDAENTMSEAAVSYLGQMV